MRVEIDQDSLRSVRLMLPAIISKAPQILARTMNDTAYRARKEGNDRIRKQVNLKQGYINKRLKVNRASHRNLSASVSAPVRGMLLSRYSTVQQVASDGISWIKPPPTPPRGIRVKVKPGRGTKVVTGGSDIKGKPFYMVLPNRKLAIVGRRTTAGPRGGKIKVLYGPSLSQVFDDVVGDLTEPMSEFAAKALDTRINDALRGY